MDESRDDAGETIPGRGQGRPRIGSQAAPDSPPLVVSSSYELIKPSPFEAAGPKVFIGPDGLRPVWRFAFFLIVYRTLCFAFRLSMYDGLPDLGQSAAASRGISGTGRGCPRGHRDYGTYRGSSVPHLRSAAAPRFRKNVLDGTVVGTYFAHVAAAGFARSQDLRLRCLALHGARLAKFAVFWAISTYRSEFMKKSLPGVIPSSLRLRRWASGRRRCCCPSDSDCFTCRIPEKAGSGFSARLPSGFSFASPCGAPEICGLRWLSHLVGLG